MYQVCDGGGCQLAAINNVSEGRATTKRIETCAIQWMQILVLPHLFEELNLVGILMLLCLEVLEFVDRLGIGMIICFVKTEEGEPCVVALGIT